MKVISLLQPWATLVVIGAKRIETRSWNTKFRGEMLIHASKRWDNKLYQTILDIGAEEILDKAGYKLTKIKNGKITTNLPTGAIIGKVNLIHTVHSEYCFEGNEFEVKDFKFELTPQERAFGDYSPGRYGWLLSNPVQFKNPIPAKGSLSIWNYDKRVCLQCGCTEDDACISKDFGPYWWVEDEVNICSHCMEGIKDII